MLKFDFCSNLRVDKVAFLDNLNMGLAGRLLCSSEFLNNQKAHPGILKLIIDKIAKVKKKFLKFSIICEKLLEDI